MPAVSETGKNLTVIISAECIPGHDWMALASWYSLNKNLPDSKVYVGCSRKHFGRAWMLYRWAYRLRIPLFYYNADEGMGRSADVVLPVTAMAVRTYDRNRLGPVDVKSQERATFVDYVNGCGRFIPGQWIDKVTGPFKNAVKRLGTNELSVNELKVLQLWERLYTLYTVI